MTVRALGYNDESLKPATGFAAYVTKAMGLNMLDNVLAGSQGCTRGMIAQLIYHALDKEIGTVDSDTQWTENWTAAMGADMMVKRLTKANNDQDVVIDEDDVAGAIVDISKYLGASAHVWKDAAGRIVAVDTVYSEYIEGYFHNGANAAGYAVFGAYKTDKLNLATTVDYFVNGEWDSAPAINALPNLTPLKLAVTISGNYITEIFSAQEWQDVDTILMDDAAIKTLNTAYTIGGNPLPLTTSDTVDTTAFDIEGAAAWSDIAAGNVVTIYVNGAGDIVKLEVGTTVVEGTVTKYSTDGTFVLGGKTLANTALVNDSLGTQNPVTAAMVADGVTYDAYCDYAGDVWAVVPVAGAAAAKTYALFLATDKVTDPRESVGAVGYMTLLLTDGTAKEFTVAPKTGDWFTAGAWNDATPDGMTALDINLVEYTLDTKGNVTALAAVAGTNAGDGTSKVTDKGTYMGYAIAEDAIIYTYAANPLTKVADVVFLKKADTIGVVPTGATYHLNAKGQIDMLWYQATAAAATTVKAVVTGASKIGDNIYETTVLENGAAKTYTFSGIAVLNAAGTAFNAVDPLVLYTLTFDTKGNVTAVTPVAGAVDGTAPFTVTGQFVTGTGLGTGKTVDAGAVIYTEKNGVYTVGSISDLAAAATTAAHFYDFDGDAVADLVLVEK